MPPLSPSNKATVVSTPVEPLLVPLSEAARLLGVKVYSIRRLTRKGQLAYKVIGNRWLVHYASLKAFAAKVAA
jgi:excisionase family DNA binding protein